MKPGEEKEIIAWNDKCPDDIQIRLILSEDERSIDFNKFCEKLSELAPKVRILKEEGEPSDMPIIRISDSLSYQAIPLGAELKPFLEALALINGNSSSVMLPDMIRYNLNSIKIPAELRLYVSQECPFCPITVRQLLPLAIASEQIRLTIIDGFLFPEMAQLDNIQSAPTLLLDQIFRWTGSVNLNDLTEMIKNRDPSLLGVASLEGMLKQGNASLLAQMMLERKNIFPAFFDLMTHEKWHLRLGAMAAIEEIAEQNKAVAAQVIQPLWERFHEIADPVKGDVIYIFGETGNSEILPMLTMVLNGSYDSEVKEAAAEAIEKISNIKTI